ncbi:MAG: dynamin family protein [Clostridia bacterium]
MAFRDSINEILFSVERLCYTDDKKENANPILNIKNEINQMKERLDEPLRVAVVGIMKAGKSTLMNAIMGENVVCTGTLETTYTVSWFKYAPTASIQIVFNDGTSLKEEFKNLNKWSVRAFEKENPRINDVKYLIVYYPSEILKLIEFIDTPGLNSSYQLDAQNTLNFLGIKNKEEAKKLEDRTMKESSKADAILYAFNHSVGSEDKELLESFHNSSQNIKSTPINSIGVLTKIDLTGAWNVFENETPTKLSMPVAETMMEKPMIKKLLFHVMPVTAKSVEEFHNITEDEKDLLKELSKLEKCDIENLLEDISYFVNECDDDELTQKINLKSKNIRKNLVAKLGAFGIYDISKHLKSTEFDEILPELKKDCGIIEVEETLKNHFGNRAFLIKSQYIFNHLYAYISDIQRKYQDNMYVENVCNQIKNIIEDFQTNEHNRKELEVLQAYYNGEVDFTDEEIQDFLSVTGEYGKLVEDRLQVKRNSKISEMRDIAKIKTDYWNDKQNGFFVEQIYKDMCRIISHSYEIIYYHLNALCEE